MKTTSTSRSSSEREWGEEEGKRRGTKRFGTDGTPKNRQAEKRQKEEEEEAETASTRRARAQEKEREREKGEEDER